MQHEEMDCFTNNDIVAFAIETKQADIGIELFQEFRSIEFEPVH